MRIVLDIEANGLLDTVDTIWCIVTKDIDTNEVRLFKGQDLYTSFPVYAKGCTQVIGHNLIQYDLPCIRNLLGVRFDDDIVYDTLVVSRLLNVGREGGHSLENWGVILKHPKTDHTDFTQISPEMIEYCKNDVELNHKVFKYLDKIVRRNGDSFTKAIECEHAIQRICCGMSDTGFKFDLDKAREIDSELEQRLDVLQQKLQQSFPPKVSSVQLKTKVKEIVTPFNPGSPKQIVDRLWEAGWNPVEKTKTHLAEKSKPSERSKRYGFKINETNLATLPADAPEGCAYLVEHILLSARRRTLKEWFQAAKCQLTLKDTENIIKLIEKRLEEKIDKDTKNKKDTRETDSTEDTTVLALTRLKHYLLSRMDAVVSAEKEKRKCVSITVTAQELYEAFSAQDVTSITNGTFRIHGQFNPLGARTHRCTHSNPNVGNIATKKTIKYNTPHLRKLAVEYGGRMRALWICPEDSWLVGTDMESAHLRIFAHLIDDKAFTQSLISGKKEDGTDPHSVNKRILGELCVDRDRAKTFIFSFLNGAGASKVSEIFACPFDAAKEALDTFIGAYPGLKELKSKVIPRDAKRGYFIGVDGRKVMCNSEHLMMGMYLQNMESVLMKYANIDWRNNLDRERVDYRQLNWIHDEWITESGRDREVAEHIGRVQCLSIQTVGEQFKLRCPMGGEYKIGKTWLEVH